MVDYAQNNDFRFDGLVNDRPGMTNRSSVHFRFCRELSTLSVSQWSPLNFINRVEKGITHCDGIKWLLVDESNVTGYFVNVLQRIQRNPYRVLFWRICFLFCHRSFASCRLTVGDCSAAVIQDLNAANDKGLPGNDGDSKVASSKIRICFFSSNDCRIFKPLSLVTSIINVCIASRFP